MGDQPAKKKLKTALQSGFGQPSTKNAVFIDFLRDQENVIILKTVCGALKVGTSRMCAKFIEITAESARSCVSFSDAYIDFNLTDDIFPLGSIFKPGVDLLNKFLDDTPMIPEEETVAAALEKLLLFLQIKDHGALFGKRNSEVELCIILAQHLLSKLSVNESYICDSGPNYRNQVPFECPCMDKQEKVVGVIGDTSYGCMKGWHGSADIIIEEVPVGIIKEDDDGERSISSIEVKREKLSQNSKNQVLVETIVFSFLQRRKNRKKLKNCLIPGIGFGTSSNVIIYFYDSENDVLIATDVLDLFLRDGKILQPTVIVIWLALNYRLFCSGIKEGMKEHKAGFFRLVSDKLCMYTDDVTRPVHIQHTISESDTWSLGVTNRKFDDDDEIPSFTYKKLQP